MVGEVNNLMGVIDEEPWDHPSFLSMMDDLCNNQGSNDTLNATSNEPTTHLEEALPTSFSVPKSVLRSHFSCPSLCKDVTRISGLNIEVASAVGFVMEAITKGILANEFGSHPSHFMQPLESQGGGMIGKRFTSKKTMRAWKPKRTKWKMVLGMDIGLEDYCSLSMCALVGRLAYRLLCKISITEWMQATWEPIMGYSPELLNLPRGWFGFFLKTPEDTVRILDNFWAFEGGSLMLKT
jgi:hypothetical protein